MKLGALLGMLLVAGTASAGDIQGQLASDTTWTPAGNPYTLTGDVVIPAGVTLTIQPGVVVIAAGTDAQSGGSDKYRVELIARGTLRVLGTDSKPVTFRAATEGDGNWHGVRVEAGTSSTFSHAIIRDARHGLEVSGIGTTATLSSSVLTRNVYGAVVSHDGTLSMDHTLVYFNTWYGIAVADGNVSIDHGTLAYNRIYGLSINNISGSYGITVRNSIIVGNVYGIYRTNSYADTFTLSHNDVWSNSTANYSNVTEGPDSFSANPLFTTDNNFRITSHSPARNAADDGSDLGALPFSGDITPYLLQGILREDTTLSGGHTLHGDLTVPPGVTLTLAPGTTILASSHDGMGAGIDPNRVELIVRGTLRVLSTSASPVTFMYDWYNSSSGYWRGVRLETGNTTLAHLVIRNASVGLEVSGSGTSVTLSSSVFTSNGTGVSVRSGGTLAMDHTLVHSNSTTGVSVTNANATLLYSTLVSNGSFGVNVANSTRDNTVTVRNSIVANHSYGIHSASGAVTLSHNDVWNNSGGNYSGVTEGPDSISSNPLFVASWDYHLKAGSPCRGTGEGGTDMGAYPWDNVAARVEIVPNSVTVGASRTTTFTARAFNAQGEPINDVPFTWSAKESAGTIDDKGVLTAACTPGTIYSAVTATSPSGVSASASVTLEPGPAAQLSISPPVATVAAGASRSFTASVKDSCGNPVSGSVTWSTVSGSGTISPSGGYSATCTPGDYPGAVIARLGALSATVDVSVSPGEPTQLSLSPQNPSVPAGGKQSFTATATDGCGNVFTPTVAWELYNGGGTLASNGVFTAGTRAGSYSNTIHARAGWLSASTSVEVTPGPVVRVTLSPLKPSLSTSTSQQFTARAEDSFGNEQPSRPRRWSADAAAGSISATGLFTAGATPGTYEKAVEVDVDGVKASTDVVLVNRVARVEVTRLGTASLPAGGSAFFLARAFDSWGSELKNVSFTWSARAAAGSIDSSGKLTVSCVPGTVGSGVTATASGISGSMDVTIAPGAATSLALVPASVTLVAGSSTAFSVQATDTCGNTASASFGWQVVAGGGSVNAVGLFTAGTGAGFWPQTVRVYSGNLSALANVTVVPGPTARVELSPLTPSVRPGATVQFTARALDVHGNERPVRILWSRGGAAGSITSEGLFTAGPTPGDYDEAVTATADGVSASTSVRVLPDSEPDGGSDGGSQPPPPVAGCGCTSASDASASLGALLLLGLFVTRRRLFPS
jgi:MYXO-CTERM domain-containing protein